MLHKNQGIYSNQEVKQGTQFTIMFINLAYHHFRESDLHNNSKIYLHSSETKKIIYEQYHTECLKQVLTVDLMSLTWWYKLWD